MNLWKSMKEWMDTSPKKPEKQKSMPEQPAAEISTPAATTPNVADSSRVTSLYNDICATVGITQKATKKHRELFVEWYQGPVTAEAVESAIREFSKLNPKFGTPRDLTK